MRRRGESLETVADGGEDAEGDASAGHLVEKDGSGGGEEEVGSPDAEERRQFAGLREGGADLGEQVVDEDEDDGDDEAGGFTSAFGGDAERDADEHEDEAGEGIGEALVELDAVDGGLAAVGGGLGVGATPEFGERECFDVGVERGRGGCLRGLRSRWGCRWW